MWSGPKSPWKALYNSVLSMLKYTGGSDLAPEAVGARDERFDGDACCLGYGNGVFASGVCVYEAR
jgi:hypothetical protein